MEPAHMLLALGMLVSGSLNTITTNLAIKQNVTGTVAEGESATIWAKLQGEDTKVHGFDHPFFQALGMFVGEFMCMIAYAFTRRAAARNPNIVLPGGRTKGALWFAIPASLDILGTGTMYAGLCLSSASVFQMLRGSVVIFTCILTVVWLRRKVWGFQWFSVGLIVIGITIVGYVSVANAGKSDPGVPGKDATTVLFGNVLIVGAQISTAVQMCTEEKLMSKYPSAPLKVVGLEGMFGFCFLSILLVAFYYIRIDGLPLENSPDAIAQVGNSPIILASIVGNAFSIAFFNFFGISVTQQLSAAHRMVLDSVRTLVVWGASLAIGWEVFLPAQLIGFAVLSAGTCTYNEIFKLPYFDYPQPEEPLHASSILPGRNRTESELSQRRTSGTGSFVADLVKEETTNLNCSFTRN